MRQEDGQASFPCRCLCGTKRSVLFRSLGRASKSCGCLQRETSVAAARHGGSGERLNAVWRGLRQRCTNPNRREYPNYGGRGIKVCEEWSDYAVFRKWALENGYADDLDIDRINNDGDYEPTNCRFVTRSQNLRNTRRARRVTAFGETKSLTDWVEDERCSVPYATLEARLRYGWTPEDAIATPKGRWNPQRRS